MSFANFSRVKVHRNGAADFITLLEGEQSRLQF